MVMVRRACLALVVGLGCDVEPPPSTPTPAPRGPRVDRHASPAPNTEVAFARATVDALREDDWERYTNLLANRADMLGAYGGSRRSSRRQRKKRRRMVWRRVNSLRDEGGQRGWKEVRLEADRRGLDWARLQVADVRRVEVEDERLPPDSDVAQLMVELDDGSQRHWLDLGTCLRAPRGWVTLYPMTWSEAAPEPDDAESLLRGSGAEKARG